MQALKGDPVDGNCAEDRAQDRAKRHSAILQWIAQKIN